MIFGLANRIVIPGSKWASESLLTADGGYSGTMTSPSNRQFYEMTRTRRSWLFVVNGVIVLWLWPAAVVGSPISSAPAGVDPMLVIIGLSVIVGLFVLLLKHRHHKRCNQSSGFVRPANDNERVQPRDMNISSALQIHLENVSTSGDVPPRLDARGYAVMVCPACTEVHPMNTSYCVFDGSAVRPTRSLSPPTSLDTCVPGRFCHHCGGKFPTHVRYCPNDGARVAALN